MATATLMTHCGAQRVTRADLQRVEPPGRTPTWMPIKHSVLVDTLHGALTQRGLQVRREQYAVQKQGAVLFGTLDLDWYDTGISAAAIGLRTANDKSMALQLAVGMRIVVCDNLAFAGDLIALRRKHTASLDLPRELRLALDRYQERFPRLRDGVARLEATPLTEGRFKEVLHDLLAQRVLPLRLFHPVVHRYATVEQPRYGATLWAVHNAVTAQFQQLPPGPAFRATLALGRHLGLA
jgi:hypothetical protein